MSQDKPHDADFVAAAIVMEQDEFFSLGQGQQLDGLNPQGLKPKLQGTLNQSGELDYTRFAEEMRQSQHTANMAYGIKQAVKGKNTDPITTPAAFAYPEQYDQQRINAQSSSKRIKALAEKQLQEWDTQPQPSQSTFMQHVKPFAPSFELWKSQLQAVLISRHHKLLHNLPDAGFYDMYEEGISPQQAMDILEKDAWLDYL